MGVLILMLIVLAWISLPDEEIGGIDGMSKWIELEEFLELNVGCALDEGLASPGEDFNLFFAERTGWYIEVHCLGTPGHGSLLLTETAGEKVRIVLDRFMKRRQKEKEKLISDSLLTIGDVTTINLTMIKGGVQSNVVPPEFTISFDCRLSLDTDPIEFEHWAKSVCEETGSGTWMNIKRQALNKCPTRLDSTNPWWLVFKEQCDVMGLKLKPAVFPGGTDSRYLRHLGISVIGFSPMNHTPVLLHDHDEFLNETIFLSGINIYCNIIAAMANI